MTRRIASFFILLFLFAAPGLAWGDDRAVEAAEDFVSQIDFGRFGESWDEGDYLLQFRTPREEWVRTLAVDRELFGWLIERRLKLTASRGSLPGLPDGTYLIVVFDAVFENKKAAIETVIMVADEWGRWHPAGYALR